MKIKPVPIIAVALLCFLTVSCKKDSVSTGNGGKSGLLLGALGGTLSDFDEELLTGKWRFSEHIAEDYVNGKFVSSIRLGVKFYDNVEINHQDRTYKFNGIYPDAGTYDFKMAPGGYGVITFPNDPLWWRIEEEDGSDIEIIELTPTSMTWRASRRPVPTIFGYNQDVFKIVHTRIP